MSTQKRHTPVPLPTDPWHCERCTRALSMGDDGRLRHKPGKRPAAEVENADFTLFVRRIVRAMGKRVSTGNVEGLADLVVLRDDIDETLQSAVAALRSEPHNFSWAQIGDALGVTRSAAQQRFGKTEATNPRRVGGQPSHLR